MRKGFHFWSEKDFTPLHKVFWGCFITLYILSIVLTFTFGQNPIIFLSVGLIFGLIINVYRALHVPGHNLEDGLKNIDPDFYQRLITESSKVKSTGIHISSRTYREAQFKTELMKCENAKIDYRIYRYIHNIKLINKAITIISIAWFAGALILFFVIYILE